MHVRAIAVWLCCGLVSVGEDRCRQYDVAASAGAVDSAYAVRSAPSGAAPPAVTVAMRHVRLHVDEGIVLEIARLQGLMLSRATDQPPVFDDQRSYVLRVNAADITMNMPSLATLMNRHVFGYDGASLSDLTLAVTGDGRLALKGKLHKGVTVPFSAKAAVGVTDDGRLRLHVDSIKAAGVPTKGLMEVFGLDLSDVVDLKKRRDVVIDGDDIVIAPGQALPPPEIRGHLAGAAVQKGGLVLTFRARDKSDTRGRPLQRRNFISFSGGSIRFGKLTMTDADLQLIDADPRDPFDFFPARYERQLVAGYSKNTPEQGLRTFMPDYDDLARRRARVDLRPQ
jgi:hypothetical protein